MTAESTAAPPVSPKSKLWLVGGVTALVAMLSCACLVPLLGVAGYVLWREKPDQDVAQGKDEKVEQAGAQNDPAKPLKQEPKQKPPAVPPGPVESWSDYCFVPDSKITSPRLGSFAKHPYWRVPMTEGGIAKIVTAIRQVPIQREALCLDPVGGFFTFEASPSEGPDGRNHELWSCLAGSGNNEIYFLPSGPRRQLASRETAFSVLAQSLDGAFKSGEMYRKTGKGFGAWDQSLELGDPANYPDLVPKTKKNKKQ